MLSKRKKYALIIIPLLSVLAIVYLYQSYEYEYDASTPQVAWRSLLIAMRTGDWEMVEALTTDKGLIRLQNYQDRDEYIEYWSKTATILLDFKIVGEIVEDDSVTLFVGAEFAPLTIHLIKDSEGWKIDSIFPGE